MSSSSQQAAFIRATSPLSSGLAFIGAGVDAMMASPNGPSQADRDGFVARRQAEALVAGISGIETTSGLVERIPLTYRVALGPLVTGTAKLAETRVSVRTQLNKLDGHVAAGTIPKWLAAKAPQLQSSKVFVDGQSAAIAATNATVEKAVNDFSLALLTSARKSKLDELMFLESELELKTLGGTWVKECTKVGDKAKASWLVPSFDAATQTLTWHESEALRMEHNALLSSGVVFLARAIEIIEKREELAARKVEKKKTIQRAADVEMADASKPGPSTQSLIDKAINQRLKALEKRVSSVSNVLTEMYDLNRKLTRLSVDHPEKIRRFSTEAPRAIGSLHPKSLEQATEAEEGGEEGLGARRLRAETWQQAEAQAVFGPQGQGKGKGRSQVAHASSPASSSSTLTPYVYPNYRSLPDWILTVPITQAIDYIVLHTPVSVLEASQFHNYIHMSTGVNVPRKYMYNLSVGMNFMFHQETNRKLIMEAWKDFYRRISWRLYFTFQNGLDKAFDPDYYVASKKDTKPPTLPSFIELGLVEGRRIINKVIDRVPPQDNLKAHKGHPLTPEVRELYAFLRANDYVVTPTDKNLGIAVSKREWLIGKTKAMLSDENEYRRLDHIEVIEILSRKYERIQRIAHRVLDVPELSELGLDKFLVSKAPVEDDARNEKGFTIPRFYGIPKIHKTPTGFRPIIPCHSVVDGPAGKFVSKLLKPLIEAAPSVLHGSKDLAIKLSKLTLDRNRKWFLVSGDVVAFYPNVPVDPAINIVYNRWLLHTFGTDEYGLFGGELPQSTYKRADLLDKRAKAEIFKECLEVSVRKLVCQYDNEFYLQLRGLAMGVAESPDVANLYGCHFEENSGILTDENIPFYGRYIDDVLSIVYATSEQEALDYIRTRVQFDGCTITWDCSEIHCNYLDMTIYKDASSTLQTRPYRKSGNHQERIPWISAHPIDVKRGTFVGEMSRLATLSTKFDTYLDALESLTALYVKRGYPTDILNIWLKKNLHKRWDARLQPTPSGAGANDKTQLLVLKSEYNLAWNYFSANELGNAILSYWREWTERAARGEYGMSRDGRYFPAPDPQGLGVYSDVHPSLSVEVRALGAGSVWVPDLRRIGILEARTILSRRKTVKMFDLTNHWKRIVLEKLDENVLQEIDPTSVNPTVEPISHPTNQSAPTDAMDTTPDQPEPGPSTVTAAIRSNVPLLGEPSTITGLQRYEADDENEIVLHRRSSSPDRQRFL